MNNSLNKAICKKCGKLFIKRKGYINYCSNICLYSRNLSNITKKKISESVKFFFDNTKEKREDLKIKQYNISKKNKCIICNSELSYSFRNRKTCSKKCLSEYRSKIRERDILKNGTNNFSTKILKFKYNGKTYNCDSKLEVAGIIYLDKIKGITQLERFNNILTFIYKGITKRFNPDFIGKKGNKTYIIEVKMEWSKKSNHKYNQFIPYKKKSLKKYCNQKGYKMIWLDFSYDKRLRKIYKQVLKQKDLNNLVIKII